jgi:hypothetical protein
VGGKYLDTKGQVAVWNGKVWHCLHGRERSMCKECGGCGICRHGRQRPKCKECGGSQICEHERVRSECKQCGGSQICKHQRLRSVCKECGGSQICEHGRRRSQCKECRGLEILQGMKELVNLRSPKPKPKPKTIPPIMLATSPLLAVCKHNAKSSECKECVLEDLKAIGFVADIVPDK